MTAKIPTPCEASTILLTTGCPPVECSKIWLSNAHESNHIYRLSDDILHSEKSAYDGILTAFQSRLICRDQIFRLRLNYLAAQYVYEIETHTRNGNECH
jgi:hypothetical protein